MRDIGACDPCGGSTSFELAAVCVLFIVGALTSSFFPRLNFSLDMRILLLYPTVPVLIFKFISLGNM